MGYIGNQATPTFSSIEKQTITGDGSTGYTLTNSVANGNDLAVFVNNVRQEPGSGKAYTASGTTITFSEAINASDDCYVLYLGRSVATTTPPDDSVQTATIQDGAITSAKIASGAVATNNILEVVPVLADGEDITINGTTYNITGPTSRTALSTTHTVIVGSSISYTPPSGTVAVMYEFMFFPVFSDSYGIGHYIMRIGGTDIENSKISVSGTYNETPTLYRYIIPVGGTADANTGRQATWTTAKTLDVTGREYTSSYESQVHGPTYWDGGSYSGTPFTPSVVITAFGAS